MLQFTSVIFIIFLLSKIFFTSEIVTLKLVVAGCKIFDKSETLYDDPPVYLISQNLTLFDTIVLVTKAYYFTK